MDTQFILLPHDTFFPFLLYKYSNMYEEKSEMSNIFKHCIHDILNELIETCCQWLFTWIYHLLGDPKRICAPRKPYLQVGWSLYYETTEFVLEKSIVSHRPLLCMYAYIHLRNLSYESSENKTESIFQFGNWTKRIIIWYYMYIHSVGRFTGNTKSFILAYK